MKFSRYLLGSLMLGGMLFMNSCQDEIEPENGTESMSPEDDGMVDVTLNFFIDDFKDGGTRAGNEGENIEPETYILVYALRDMNDKVLSQYGQGVHTDFKNADGSLNREAYPALKYYIEDVDNNQTLVPIYNFNKNKPNQTVYSFTLRVMRGTTFKLSVWLQSSKCKIYDFNYLTAVMVRYDLKDEDNNPENYNNKANYDAFCATSIFSIGQVDSDVQMTLTRPFAQVNVAMNKDAITNEPGERYEDYVESEIVLEGVATYFNVVENKTWSQQDYEKYKQDKASKKTNYNNRIFYDENDLDEEDKEVKDNISIEYRKPVFTTTATFKMNAIYRDELTINDYTDWGSTETPNPVPKTYKCLSMSYVLVPEDEYSADDDGKYKEDGYATDKDGNAWVTITDFFGNAVTLKNPDPKESGEWAIVKVIDPNDEDVTNNYKSGQAKNKSTLGAVKGGTTITQNYEEYEKLVEEDGSINYGKLKAIVSLEYIVNERRWKVTEAKDAEGNDITGSYKYESDLNGGVIYPGTPDEQNVQLTLLSLFLKGNKNGTPDIEYSVPKQLPVRRNWRTNLLFDTWNQLKNPSKQ